jgi:hypothetical protein
MRHSLRRRYGHATTKRGLKEIPPIGTKVRLTGAFLKSTGQQRGSEGVSVWHVIGSWGGDHVYVDEPLDPKYVREMWGDLPEAERPKWRSFHKGNLQIVGAKPQAGDYP